jgi:hypothetical protein
MTAPLQAIVVTGAEEARRKMVPARWWAALLGIAPRALTPTAAKLKSRAPRGRSGKLSRGFDVRAKPIHQGFIQGVQAEIGARVSYGHLVTRGHQVIARGRGRGTKGAQIGNRTVTRNRMRGGFVVSERVTLAVRSTRAAELKARRAAGALGFVPGNPFAEQTFLEDRVQIIRLIEKLLEQDVSR